MKTLAIAAAAALLLGSAAAIAQMHQHGTPSGTDAMPAPGMMQSKMKSMMQEKMKSHGMPHTGMDHGGSSHGGMDHSAGRGTGHDHAAAGPKGDTGPSSRAFHDANTRMHAGMDITFTGDADADFVSGMIPHHQGAVDMAKVVLAHGKDAQVRKLAEEIVRTQEAEIAQMKAWLARRKQQQ